MKIGKIKLKNPYILAPLDAVNCAAFRLLCKDQGASLVYSQMLHAQGLVEGKETFIQKYVDANKDEKPVTFQIVGKDPNYIKQATEILDQNKHIDIIDFNMGCSMPKVLGLKCGAYFIRHPEQIEKSITQIINNTNKPVTAKIRIGWDSQSLNHIKVTKILEDLGVAAVAVHGRTKQQLYTGKANWTAIKQVKDKLNIPVIGNGDIFKPEEAKNFIELSNVNAVMIGRGAIGNPFIFKQLLDYKKTGKYKQTEVKEIKQTFLKFLEYYQKYQKRNRFPEIKQHASWFMKFIPKAKDYRERILKTKTIEEVKDIYSEI